MGERGGEGGEGREWGRGEGREGRGGNAEEACSWRGELGVCREQWLPIGALMRCSPHEMQRIPPALSRLPGMQECTHKAKGSGELHSRQHARALGNYNSISQKCILSSGKGGILRSGENQIAGISHLATKDQFCSGGGWDVCVPTEPLPWQPV